MKNALKQNPSNDNSVADSKNDSTSNKTDSRIAMKNALKQNLSNDNSVADSKNDSMLNKTDDCIAMKNVSKQNSSNDVSFSIVLRTVTEMQIVDKMNVDVAKTNNISVQDNTDINLTNDER